MDGDRFDAVTKALAGASTRRGALRLLAGGALAGALARLDPGGAAAQDVGAAHCVPNGTICTGRKRLGTRHRHSCRDCCSGFTRVGAGAARRCSCRPDGVSCGGSAAKCCSGVCGADGTCGDPGAACRAGEQCSGGRCCPTGSGACPGNPVGCLSPETCSNGGPVCCSELGQGAAILCGTPEGQCPEGYAPPPATCPTG